MFEIHTMLFMVGAFLVLVGIFGGFKVKEIEVPKTAGIARVGAFAIGLAFAVAGLALKQGYITPNGGEPQKSLELTSGAELAARTKVAEEVAAMKKAVEEALAMVKAAEATAAKAKAAEEVAAAKAKAAEEEAARARTAGEEAAQAKAVKEAAVQAKAAEEAAAKAKAAEEAAAKAKAAEEAAKQAQVAALTPKVARSESLVAPQDIPTDSRSAPLVQKMLERAKAGDTAEVMALRDRILSLDKPSHGDRTEARRQNGAGLDEVKRGEYAAAAAAFLAALQADGADVEVANNLGFAFQMAGDLPAARHALIYTLGLAPDRGAAWNTLGFVLAQENDVDGAVGCFRNLLLFSKNPASSRTYLRGRMEDPSTVPALRTAIEQVLAESPQADEGTYYVVARSLKIEAPYSQERAIRDAGALQGKGYGASVWRSVSGYYAVVIGEAGGSDHANDLRQKAVTAGDADPDAFLATGEKLVQRVWP